MFSSLLILAILAPASAPEPDQFLRERMEALRANWASIPAAGIKYNYTSAIEFVPDGKASPDYHVKGFEALRDGAYYRHYVRSQKGASLSVDSKWDGETYMSLTNSVPPAGEQAAARSTGKIRKEPQRTMPSMPSLQLQVVMMWPLLDYDFLLALVDPDDWHIRHYPASSAQLRMERGTMPEVLFGYSAQNGITRITSSFSDPTMISRHGVKSALRELTFDEQVGGMPVAFDLHSHGIHQLSGTISWMRVNWAEDSAWFPFYLELRRPDPLPGKHLRTYVAIDRASIVVGDVNLEEYAVTFPPGTRVHDMRRDKVYEVPAAQEVREQSLHAPDDALESTTNPAPGCPCGHGLLR